MQVVHQQISLNIYEKAFDILMSNLCQEDGNKYKLGDMSFDSKKEIFDLIRNKLLHGDYVIDLEGYKVILNDKGVTGSIDIIDLVETCKSLCTSGSWRSWDGRWKSRSAGWTCRHWGSPPGPRQPAASAPG